MLTTIILIPVNDWDIGERFYRDIIGFSVKDDDFYPSDSCTCVCVNLIIAPVDARQKYGLPDVDERFPLFRYFVKRNFLSYCKGILERGCKFIMVRSHPGGYFARIADPFGNTFEVLCDNQDEDDNTINPYAWPFFKR